MSSSTPPRRDVVGVVDLALLARRRLAGLRRDRSTRQSSPAATRRQSSSTFGAPGNRPAIPTMAMSVSAIAGVVGTVVGHRSSPCVSPTASVGEHPPAHRTSVDTGRAAERRPPGSASASPEERRGARRTSGRSGSGRRRSGRAAHRWPRRAGGTPSPRAASGRRCRRSCRRARPARRARRPRCRRRASRCRRRAAR